MTQSALPAPIAIPLSVSGPADAFAAALTAYAAALAAHRVGKAGVPAPVASALFDSLVQVVPQAGPVATRGPDAFQVRPYQIVDDTPKPELPLEQSQALSVLRETLAP